MPTIGGTVVHNARRVPGREALVAGSQRWTWRELDDLVARVAGTLAAAGLGKGDRFAVLSANCPEHIFASYAALRLGAIVVPVNARLAPAELHHVLTDSGATMVAAAPEQLEIAETVCAQLTTAPLLYALADGTGHPNLLARTDAAAVTEDRARESDDAYILYTSGTTGKPKGALLDHHRAVWAALSQIMSLGLRDGERYLHLSPLYHSGGVTYLNATTLLGGCHILIPAFEPGAVLETIEQQQVSVFLGVPTMYQFLLRHPGVGTRDLSSWRIGIFGAAPMPATAAEALLTTFPHVEFFQQCGQTEAGPTGIYSTMEQVRAQPDSSGHLAQPFVEARVVDRHGADAEPDTVGELLLRAEAAMKGYWHNPEATAETMRGGWVHTGDLVHLAPDGAMRLVDRLEDVIITGGRNVYSAEVEQALAQHPDVLDCAVIARPHEDWGATVVAVVTPRDGTRPTLDQLRAHCLPLIADYKLPRELILGPVPRNAGGKVQKYLLRAQLGS
ncbi:class I adenylate-forming enzyme family protein [Nocardia miyunensis]|uniref:class I adenylate-forming enzyme family protein n=1 Tax=Nocardia miyunensis TaxID=282684 RepID=UPI00082F81B6|nr:AMP-binding protein [Nocardia miyunensis]